MKPLATLNKPVLKALDYAIAARHESIEAIHVSIDDIRLATIVPGIAAAVRRLHRRMMRARPR